ncbi:MAG: sulfur oxidation c-type cytochrome SoxA [Campylobacterales bacterium]
MQTQLFKLTLAAALMGAPFLMAEEDLSMTEADKAMYEEMTENNPAEIFLMEGEELLSNNVGGEAGLAKFMGVKEDNLAKELATYPKYVKKIGMVVGIDQLLQAAMAENGKKPFKLASKEMVYMGAYVKSLANEEPINLDLSDKHTKEYLKLGEEVYHTRRGGRGLSCYSCHSEATIGTRLRMQILPALGDPKFKSAATWPAYRMTQSKLVTLQGRFRGCMNNSLMAKLPEGSKEMVALEVYVSAMAQGESVQLPGLKR